MVILNGVDDDADVAEGVAVSRVLGFDLGLEAALLVDYTM